MPSLLRKNEGNGIFVNIKQYYSDSMTVMRWRGSVVHTLSSAVKTQICVWLHGPVFARL